MHEVEIAAKTVEPFERLLGKERVRQLRQKTDALRDRLGARVIWNINSTERGGGVAELLRPLVGYSRGLGWDVRWLVLQGTPEFFHLTKRLHHALHGSAGDASLLSHPSTRELYEQVLHTNASTVAERIRPGDVVILHD